MIFIIQMPKLVYVVKQTRFSRNEGLLEIMSEIPLLRDIGWNLRTLI